MSETLYRSPNLVIDAHEWHVWVIRSTGRYGAGSVIMQYRWRPLSAKAFQWLPITAWQGPKPKRLGHKFSKFRLHVALARDSARIRAEALGKRRASTAAVVANMGVAA